MSAGSLEDGPKPSTMEATKEAQEAQLEAYRAAMRARHTNAPAGNEQTAETTAQRSEATEPTAVALAPQDVTDANVEPPPQPEPIVQNIDVPEGHVHDEVTGQVRRADAQGPMMRLNDFGDAGPQAHGGGFPGFRPDLDFPGQPFPPPFRAGAGGSGGPPQLPQGLEQALTPSQRQLLMEAMAEMGGGGPPGMFGGGGPPGMFGGGGPGGGFPGPGGFPGGGFPGGRRGGDPFGAFLGEDEGTPSNWDPRNARMTAEEEAIARRQAAELRARAAGQQPPPSAAQPSTAAADAAAVPRGAPAPAPRQEYGAAGGAGSDLPPQVRAHLERMQGIRQEWGPPGAMGMGGLDRDEDMTFERLSALTERIGK